MVQGKLKARGGSNLRKARNKAAPYNKKNRTNLKKKQSNKRKAAPLKAKNKSGVKGAVAKDRRKVQVAIDKNIEAIMAARVVRDGGRFAVLETPKDVPLLSGKGGKKKMDDTKRELIRKMGKGRIDKKMRKAEKKIQKALQKL
eukprot:TRINITY_DN66371_c10_g1_i1.p2 TRINITY_DN66371_c10_g1~~TRINITY_DN66371_c10_g1_i1.p2  ORF type:complete len:143 (-),score=107.49 TRINITY_DN66371_c10_g1_i1:111-539(-)